MFRCRNVYFNQLWAFTGGTGKTIFPYAESSFPMKKTSLPFSLCSIFSSIFLIFGAQTSASAVPVFSWGGSYGAGNYTVDEPVRNGIISEVASVVSAWRYSDITPKISGYGGPDVYGAISIVNSADTRTSLFRPTYDGYYQNGSAGVASIRFSINNSANNIGTMSGLIFFKKDAFLGKAATSQVKFDENSKLTMKLSSSIATVSRTFRFAVYARTAEDGDYAWYISAKSGSGSSAASVLDNPYSSNWALWDVHASEAPEAPVNPMPASFNIPGSSFTDIAAVGYLFQFVESDAKNANIHLEYFSIDAQVMPDPSVTILGVGGLIFALCVRQLHRGAKFSPSIEKSPRL